jgi:hypothetical protein
MRYATQKVPEHIRLAVKQARSTMSLAATVELLRISEPTLKVIEDPFGMLRPHVVARIESRLKELGMAVAT